MQNNMKRLFEEKDPKEIKKIQKFFNDSMEIYMKNKENRKGDFEPISDTKSPRH